MSPSGQPHAEMFDSPKAYALVIEALLDRGDYVASMALLMHWLGQADQIGLERADASFHDLAERWFGEMTLAGRPRSGAITAAKRAQSAGTPARKFLDYLEANAEAYLGRARSSAWAAARQRPAARRDEPRPDDDEDDEDRFESAYEGMVFRDSTDDGVEGSIFETDEASHDELLAESKRVADRLEFLATVARLWKHGGGQPGTSRVAGPGIRESLGAWPPRTAALRRWIEQAEANRAALARLMAAVRDYPHSQPVGRSRLRWSNTTAGG